MLAKCPECGLTNPANAKRCDCGYDFGKQTPARRPCPNCGLVSPGGVEVCDCGYDFGEGRVPETAIRDPERQAELQRARRTVRTGWLLVALGVLLIVLGAWAVGTSRCGGGLPLVVLGLGLIMLLPGVALLLDRTSRVPRR